MKMIDKALETIKRYDMIAEGDTIAVCLSGGADSMALFHLLCCNKDKLAIKLLALHVNHGLRPESRQEEIFVRKYCEKQGVECLVLKADMSNKAKPQGLSVEMWARKIRYDFFEEISQKYGAKLAMAHTLSDRCETVLFNIARGAGTKGGVGIPAKRDGIIRPLIQCTRSQIEEYCGQKGIPYVTDATNFEDIYARNKIRLKVIPILRQINPTAENSIGDFSAENEEIYTFLTQLSDNLYKNSTVAKGFDVSVIKSADKVIIKSFLRNILEGYGCLSRDNILSILQGIFTGELQRQLSRDLICQIKDGCLTFYPPKVIVKSHGEKKQAAQIGQITQFLSKNYSIFQISREEFEKIREKDKKCLTYCLSCDIIYNMLFLRTRKTGDTFSDIKRNVTKTIKKLFIEDKVPLEKRAEIAILSNEADDVLWLEGYGTNGPYSVTEKTTNILIIKQE